ncbi:MAG: hypothetical protein K9M07_05425 [Simkaniaceae bacterium]|nr:hypothetical protein [Simkaniaceae bacterium]MCF7852660.1 hypothetical protein [Simkaniaceae bacterium]
MSKPILQEHGMGCGVACVAFALKTTYQKALKLFENPENAWTKGYICRDIIQALHKGKREYRHFWYQLKHEEFTKQTGVIVYTKRSEKYPAGHYLIKTENGMWMNPWSNFPVIHPLEGAFQKRLPGEIGYIMIPVEHLTNSPRRKKIMGEETK